MSSATDKAPSPSKIEKGLEFLFSKQDEFENPIVRKIARIATSIIIILLGLGVFWVATHTNFMNLASMTHLDLAALANPSMTTMMGMPIGMGISGVGISWLLQDILPKKYHRTTGKIMAFLMPIFLAGGTACIMGAGLHAGMTTTSAMNSYWFAGLILLPLSFISLSHALRRLGEKRVHFETAGLQRAHQPKYPSSQQENEIEMQDFSSRTPLTSGESSS